MLTRTKFLLECSTILTESIWIEILGGSGNSPRSIYQHFSMTSRLSGQSFKLVKVPLSHNSQFREQSPQAILTKEPVNSGYGIT